MAGPDVIGADEVTRRLARDMPQWRLEGRALKRLYKVNGFRSALLAANAVGHLAETAWHHPDLAISWGKVEVTLWSHDAGGVTERDMALARRIEEVLAWRPPTGSPLEGTPADGQYAYVLAD